MYGLNCWEVYV